MHHWKQWVRFRDSESEKDEVLRSLLNTENPEIALSALDLLKEAREDHVNSVLTGKETEKMQKASDRLKPHALWDVDGARHGLLRCLNDFFGLESFREERSQKERRYLRSLFKQLRSGGTVITLNWDSTAERTLGEMGLWNPSDGYGVIKNLSQRTQLTGNECSQKPQTGIPTTVDLYSHRRTERCPLPSSPVKVLKLHGSVGWWHKEGSVEGIFFDPSFLQRLFRIQLDESVSTFSDPEYSPDIGTEPKPVMVVPTFLKSVPEGAGMQRIWHLADEALAKADVVEVIGYSLPPSDSAMRALLNKLRFRAEARHVHVHVYDPNEGTRKRWNDFIGADVSTPAELRHIH